MGPAKDLAEPPLREEYQKDLQQIDGIKAIKRLSLWQRLADITAFRRIGILLLLAVLWQAYSQPLNNPFLLPTFLDVAKAFTRELMNGDLVSRAAASVVVLLKGYLLAILIAGVMTTLAVSTRFGNDLLATLTAMFNPLPAIALLPIALLWFGLGEGSLIFVLVHAVVWPLSLNTHSGFTEVSETLRMVGRNFGLKGVRFVLFILIPAAFPSILAGLKIGWAFAWRTLIAAELVFGVSSGSGGLGWFIFQNKNELEIANVFAGLGTVIIIGLLVENVFFRSVEAMTVRRWGMVH